MASSKIKFDLLEGGCAKVICVKRKHSDMTGHKPDWSLIMDTYPVGVQKQSAELLRRYLMDHISDRLEAGQMDFLNEIRRLTVVFVGFPDLTKGTAGGLRQLPSEDLQEVLSCFLCVQSAMRFWRGSLMQMRCDEKGFLAVCAFGFPGKGHKDIENRGIQSALQIVRASGNTAVIGVTTGNLLCACVGAKSRAEYTVFGDAINLSARLMCKAKSGVGDVLCDEETYSCSSKSEGLFDQLEPIQVKGRSQKVVIYRVNTFSNKMPSPRLTDQPSRLFVGREDVIESVRTQVAKFTACGDGSAILIKGSKMVGKSSLMQRLQSLYYESTDDVWAGARETSNLFFGQGIQQESRTMLYPWRGILRDMHLYAQKAQHPDSDSPLDSFLQELPECIKRFYAKVIGLNLCTEILGPEDQSSHTDKASFTWCDHSNRGFEAESDCRSLQRNNALAPYDGHTESIPNEGVQPIVEGDITTSLHNSITEPTMQEIVHATCVLLKYFRSTIGQCLILLEDLRNFDEASLNVLKQVTSEGILIIITMRSYGTVSHPPSTMV